MWSPLRGAGHDHSHRFASKVRNAWPGSQSQNGVRKPSQTLLGNPKVRKPRPVRARAAPVGLRRVLPEAAPARRSPGSLAKPSLRSRMTLAVRKPPPCSHMRSGFANVRLGALGSRPPTGDHIGFALIGFWLVWVGRRFKFTLCF